jgi:hypothetical protein
MDQIITVFVSSDPAALLKTGIKFSHLIGLVVGLGAATVLDLVILRFITVGKIAPEHASVIEFCSKLVTAGLFVLWASGAAFLLHYYAFDPAKLGNEKVWAKIAIVGILTVNGYFIHNVVLPLVRGRIGYSLFEGLPVLHRTLLLIFGTVSVTSWYVPLLLGAVPQLNFVVPATTLLLAYAVVLGVAILITQAMAHILLHGASSSRVERPLSRVEIGDLRRVPRRAYDGRHRLTLRVAKRRVNAGSHG